MEIVKKKSGRPTNRPSLDVLAMLYKKSTASEIAKQYGVKESTVRSWIARARKEAENK